MAINLVRYALQDEHFWGVAHSGGIAPIAGTYGTTAALIEKVKAIGAPLLRKRRPCLSTVLHYYHPSRRRPACCVRAPTIAST